MIGQQHILYSKEKKFTLVWNPKSASALAVHWFFYQIDRDEQITNTKMFPHSFRSKVDFNLKKTGKIPKLEEILKTNLICVVRHPYHRVISMYKHFIMHNWVNTKVSNVVNKKIDNKNKLSFIEFLDFLGKIDLNNFDTHFHPQARNFLKDTINYEIVKSENFFDNIKIAEKKFNLRESPIENFSKNLEYHNKKKGDSIITPCFDIQFNPIDYQEFPKDEYFLNDEIKLIIQNLYPNDFVQFKYEY